MHALQEKIAALKEDGLTTLASVMDVKSLDDVRVKFLGRKSAIQDMMKDLKNVSKEDRPVFGRLVNELKVELTSKFEEKIAQLKAKAEKERVAAEWIDVTLPGKKQNIGTPHILLQVIDDIVAIFNRIGFSVVQGPEVESDYYNFEALNIPADHPARDMHDTFFVADDIVLRTHTSPVQIRVMEKQQPPIHILVPGRVYRNEAIDASHHAVFYQIEGLCVDKGITFLDLKGILAHFVREFFGSDFKVRFRPSFFPFTEPSAEVDMSCIICGGKGCSVCKQTGWVEILGCGMVDPAVYKYVNYDPEVYTGYAFGLGVERIAMLKHRINDIRLFLDNDIRFLRQF